MVGSVSPTVRTVAMLARAPCQAHQPPRRRCACRATQRASDARAPTPPSASTRHRARPSSTTTVRQALGGAVVAPPARPYAPRVSMSFHRHRRTVGRARRTIAPSATPASPASASRAGRSRGSAPHCTMITNVTRPAPKANTSRPPGDAPSATPPVRVATALGQPHARAATAHLVSQSTTVAAA